MVSKEVKEFTVDYAKDLWKNKTNRYFTIALIIFLVCAGGYYLYSWNFNSQQLQAQKAFLDGISVYNRASESAKSEESKDSWEEVDLVFKSSHQKNSGSTIAPFFKAYESIAQEELGDIEGAKENWQQITKTLKSGKIADLYKIKLALMNINSGNEDGILQLEAEANSSNAFKDMANFYLGEYYLSKSDFKEAKQYFEKSIQLNPDSEWGKLAKANLES